MKIGIDILGGDFAPEANIAGAVLAKKELPQDVQLVLIGDQEQILSGLNALGESAGDYIIEHAPDVITMHDHPTRAIPQKPYNSIEHPRVALLNIGEEETKGNLLTIATHKLMAESDEINFIGNLEGRDLFNG